MLEGRLVVLTGRAVEKSPRASDERPGKPGELTVAQFVPADWQHGWAFEQAAVTWQESFRAGAHGFRSPVVYCELAFNQALELSRTLGAGSPSPLLTLCSCECLQLLLGSLAERAHPLARVLVTEIYRSIYADYEAPTDGSLRSEEGLARALSPRNVTFFDELRRERALHAKAATALRHHDALREREVAAVLRRAAALADAGRELDGLVEASARAVRGGDGPTDAAQPLLDAVGGLVERLRASEAELADALEFFLSAPVEAQLARLGALDEGSRVELVLGVLERFGAAVFADAHPDAVCECLRGMLACTGAQDGVAVVAALATDLAAAAGEHRLELLRALLDADALDAAQRAEVLQLLNFEKGELLSLLGLADDGGGGGGGSGSSGVRSRRGSLGTSGLNMEAGARPRRGSHGPGALEMGERDERAAAAVAFPSDRQPPPPVRASQRQPSLEASPTRGKRATRSMLSPAKLASIGGGAAPGPNARATGVDGGASRRQSVVGGGGASRRQSVVGGGGASRRQSVAGGGADLGAAELSRAHSRNPSRPLSRTHSRPLSRSSSAGAAGTSLELQLHSVRQVRLAARPSDAAALAAVPARTLDLLAARVLPPLPGPRPPALRQTPSVDAAAALPPIEAPRPAGGGAAAVAGGARALPPTDDGAFWARARAAAEARPAEAAAAMGLPLCLLLHASILQAYVEGAAADEQPAAALAPLALSAFAHDWFVIRMGSARAAQPALCEFATAAHAHAAALGGASHASLGLFCNLCEDEGERGADRLHFALGALRALCDEAARVGQRGAASGVLEKYMVGGTVRFRLARAAADERLDERAPPTVLDLLWPLRADAGGLADAPARAARRPTAAAVRAVGARFERAPKHAPLPAPTAAAAALQAAPPPPPPPPPSASPLLSSGSVEALAAALELRPPPRLPVSCASAVLRALLSGCCTLELFNAALADVNALANDGAERPRSAAAPADAADADADAASDDGSQAGAAEAALTLDARLSRGSVDVGQLLCLLLRTWERMREEGFSRLLDAYDLALARADASAADDALHVGRAHAALTALVPTVTPAETARVCRDALRATRARRADGAAPPTLRAAFAGAAQANGILHASAAGERHQQRPQLPPPPSLAPAERALGLAAHWLHIRDDLQARAAARRARDASRRPRTAPRARALNPAASRHRLRAASHARRPASARGASPRPAGSTPRRARSRARSRCARTSTRCTRPSRAPSRRWRVRAQSPTRRLPRARQSSTPYSTSCTSCSLTRTVVR
jgi:hypothetical protein